MKKKVFNFRDGWNLIIVSDFTFVSPWQQFGVFGFRRGFSMLAPSEGANWIHLLFIGIVAWGFGNLITADHHFNFRSRKMLNFQLFLIRVNCRMCPSKLILMETRQSSLMLLVHLDTIGFGSVRGVDPILVWQINIKMSAQMPSKTCSLWGEMLHNYAREKKKIFKKTCSNGRQM